MRLTSTILIALSLLSAAACGQTLEFEMTGLNPGDRSGSYAGWGYYKSAGTFGCYIEPRRIATAPGWSNGTGRLEFWRYPTLNNPDWHVSPALSGAAPGEEFGHALALGHDGHVYDVGAPGASGGQGYVQRVEVNSCFAAGAFSSPWTTNGDQAGARFGHAVANVGDIDGDNIEDVIVGAPLRDNVILFAIVRFDAGAAYVLSGVDGSIIYTHLGSTTDGKLGQAVAGIGDVDGDGVPDYAIGEPGYNHATGGTTWNDAGRVRVYSGATGLSLPSLWSTGPKAGAEYGSAIAGCGDANKDGTPDHVVGAPSYDAGSGLFQIFDIGQVQVRSGADASILYQTTGPLLSRLGTSVAGNEDLDNDGWPEIVVGGPSYDSDRGMARVISMRTQSVLYAVEGEAGEELGAFVGLKYGDWFVGTPGRATDRGGWRTYEGQVDWKIQGTFTTYGSSLAVLDDVDGDGWDDFAVGQYDTSVNYVAPIWDVRSGRTSEVLHHFSGSAQHGHTVGRVGDVDGDGIGDIAHGKPWEGVVEIRSGASPDMVIRTHTAAVGTLFGHLMTDAGDVDGDGTRDYLVAEPLYDVGAPLFNSDAGRVHVFSGATGLLIRVHTGAAAGDQLGLEIAAMGDVDGDGWDDYGAGAPFADLATIILSAGRAYVWSGFDGSLIWTASGTTLGAQFGRGLCGPGDVDGDGFADIAVGEPYWGPVIGDNHGRVRVFKGGPAGSSFAQIHSIQGVWQDLYSGYAMEAIGDIDADGIGDIAYSSPRFGFEAGSFVHAISGATGQELFIRTGNGHWPWGGHYGLIIAGKRDGHADLRHELLIGAPSTTSLGGLEVVMLPEAHTWDLGGACGSAGPDQPSLSFTKPRLGQLVTMTLADLPATAGPASLLISAPTSTPQLLGFGCEVWVDVPTVSILATLPGNVQFSAFLVDDYTLAGITAHLQVVAFDNNAPLGIVLTNGVAFRMGY